MIAAIDAWKSIRAHRNRGDQGPSARRSGVSESDRPESGRWGVIRWPRLRNSGRGGCDREPLGRDPVRTAGIC
jgi:hypothetical protein